MTNDTEHFVTVAAINTVGTGPPSTVASGTPMAVGGPGPGPGTVQPSAALTKQQDGREDDSTPTDAVFILTLTDAPSDTATGTYTISGTVGDEYSRTSLIEGPGACPRTSLAVTDSDVATSGGTFTIDSATGFLTFDVTEAQAKANDGDLATPPVFILWLRSFIDADIHALGTGFVCAGCWQQDFRQDALPSFRSSSIHSPLTHRNRLGNLYESALTEWRAKNIILP